MKIDNDEISDKILRIWLNCIFCSFNNIINILYYFNNQINLAIS